MPGRPKMMARRTSDLEYRSVALLDSLRRWKPSLFSERERFEEITEDWHGAKYYAYRAAATFSVLANHYRMRVGIEDFGPFYVWCHRYEDEEFSPERVNEIMQAVYAPADYARIKNGTYKNLLPQGWRLPPFPG